ncbi:uncharacterized protein LOC110973579 [Acanthaster planci]|uniref:Uncharacterized protein LOC110973579 n=1 Tax=Acanthaster planci TaxID=133434 RepID=A0A8B7XJP5_ACAPL|nr:uncharacterized protein LOC110973579 [Acanthaster planci]
MADEERETAFVPTEDMDEEISELGPSDADSVNTKKQIKYAVARLEEFAKHTGTSVEALTDSELDSFLSQFYVALRRENGELYTKKSMHGIRYGLHRHFQSVRGIDINDVKVFVNSSRAYRAMMVKLKMEGKGSVKHKDPITKQDMARVISSLDVNTPQGLQDKVFVDIMVYFGNRGRENLREMKITDFVLQNDGDHKYVIHRDMLARAKREDEAYSGVMREIPGSSKCPVSTFLAFKEVLNPEVDCMWQRPKLEAPTKGPWYTNAPLGINTLATKMKTIGERAGCSVKYTNHSLRATTVTVLDAAGFVKQDVPPVRGNRPRQTERQRSARLVARTPDSDLVPAEEERCSDHVQETGRTQDEMVKKNGMEVDNPLSKSPKHPALCESSCSVNSAASSHGHQQDFSPGLPGNSTNLRNCPGFHGWKDVCYLEPLVKEITGLSLGTFNLLLPYLPKASLVQWGLSAENNLLVFLMRLKMATPFKHLAAQFGVSPATAEQVFILILVTLTDLTSGLIRWPPKSVVRSTMPAFIRRSFPHCRLITDCLEIETEALSQLFDQLLMICKLDSAFKVKALIGLTPSGYVCFVSKLFGGSISQDKLSQESSLQYFLNSGDEILSLTPDRYLPSLRGIKVHTAPVSPQFPEVSLIYREDAASLNCHFDKLQQRLRTFGILRSKVSLDLLPHLDSVLHICAALSNLETISGDV